MRTERQSSHVAVRFFMIAMIVACVSHGVLAGGPADPADAARRGWTTLTTKPFTPPAASWSSYRNAWQQWGLDEKPENYDKAFRQRYGLLTAPYENAGLPMGLREAPGVFRKGIAHDCLLCHAGRVAGVDVVGLGNASLDFEALVDEVYAAGGSKPPGTPVFSRSRGTIEAGAAIGYLMQFRDAELNVRPPSKLTFATNQYEDVPAWWLLKKKRTIYHTGGADARSVRTMMTFMLHPFNSGETIKGRYSDFADIRAFILSTEPPEYPFEIDRKLAARGALVFNRTCAECHGSYGENPAYPNRIVPVEEVGTDPTLARFEGYDERTKAIFAESWFFLETGPDGEPYSRPDEIGGYQAPPLDGVWATAPYFHNASVPTIHHVLSSTTRPDLYTRTFRTEREDYDEVKVGWKIQTHVEPPPPDLPAYDRRKIYDASELGRSNAGHTFGDGLNEMDRLAVIEYLKTL